MNGSILLMYISENSGHHSATISIEQALRSQNSGVHVLNVNGFRYVSPIMEKVVNALYMKAIHRLPQLWDFLYDNPAIEIKLKKIKERVNQKKRDTIKRLIESNNCKVVICSQAFPCGIVAEYKKRYFSDLVLIAAMTDFIPHLYWVYDEVDFYVVPSERAKEILVKKGVKEDKIKIFGIPIDQKFSKTLDRVVTAKELNIEIEKAVVLIMGGSRGFGPIKSLVTLLDKSDIEANFIVVSGANARLFKWLKKREFSKQVYCYPKIDYVDKLMSISDIIVTKPGGITTAESIAKRLPMIIVNPIPGQEENNTDFLLREGIAVKAQKVEDVVSQLNTLLHDKAKMQSIKERMSALARPFSSVKIAELALSKL